MSSVDFKLRWSGVFHFERERFRSSGEAASIGGGGLGKGKHEVQAMCQAGTDSLPAGAMPVLVWVVV